MNERLARLAAVIRADFLIRLRRSSTIVVFLLLSGSAYLWIPDPATGRTLMDLGGKRAIYNSAAIGMGTAALGSMFIGLFGFYVISNALKRDVLSRCGYVIASTTMRGSEYIAGKFAGNVVFLSVFMLGFMAVSMSMVIVRGEAPLEPLVFATQYLMLVPPSIVFVSAIAIFFECTPLLRSKFGDVAYFFTWVMVMGAVVAMIDKGVGRNWAPYFDVSGLGFLMEHIKTTYNTNHMSLGSTPFDPSKGTTVFHGLQADPRWLLPRLGAMIWPLSFLVLARVFFHRFDPARVRAVPNEKSRTSWLGRLNALAKPLAHVIVSLGSRLAASQRPSLLRSAIVDAVATLGGFPLATVAIIGFAIAALASDAKSLLTGVMPIAYAGCAIAIADVASREKRAGTLALVFASPHLRARFVLWKFFSSLLLALAFLAVPLLRALIARPSSLLALLVGIVFVSAAATALGIVSSNPKTFLVVFLSFWYVTTQDRGTSPSLDFAGWYGTVTPLVLATYALLALAFLALAHLFHTRELRLRW